MLVKIGIDKPLLRFGRVGFGDRNNVSKETNHHFFPCLVAPLYGLGWIRIEFIIGRIIEMSGAFDRRTLGNELRLFEEIRHFFRMKDKTRAERRGILSSKIQKFNRLVALTA